MSANVCSTALRVSGWSSDCIVVCERRGHFSISIGLGEQVLSFLLERLNGISASGPAHWGLGLAREFDECPGELGGVTTLQSVHFLPGRNRLPGFLRVVVD